MRALRPVAGRNAANYVAALTTFRMRSALLTVSCGGINRSFEKRGDQLIVGVPCCQIGQRLDRQREAGANRAGGSASAGVEIRTPPLITVANTNAAPILLNRVIARSSCPRTFGGVA